MTNLSPDQSVWRRRFSRGRILVGVPAAFGVVLAGALLTGLAWPRLGVIEEKLETADMSPEEAEVRSGASLLYRRGWRSHSRHSSASSELMRTSPPSRFAGISLGAARARYLISQSAGAPRPQR